MQRFLKNIETEIITCDCIKWLLEGAEYLFSEMQRVTVLNVIAAVLRFPIYIVFEGLLS